jgi:NifU-like protein involved in Fe-S cluster formation
VLAEDAIKAAISDYKHKQGQNAPAETVSVQ